MKSIIVFILSLFFIGAASSQSYNRIPGKQDFTDSIKFSKYLNSVGEDSVLTIDRVTKKLKFVAKGGGMTAFTFMLNYDGKRFLMYTNGVLTDSTASGVKDAYGLGGIRIVDSLGNVYIDGSGISGGSGTDTSYLTNGDSILNIKNTDGDIQSYNFAGGAGGSGSTFNPDTLEAAIALKLNISDTAAMLSPYQSAINSKLTNITGLVTAGTNVTVTGSGTSGSPYIISASGTSVTTSEQVLTATASQTAFTFTSVPSSYDDYLVFVNGGLWYSTTGYTTSGNIVTLTTPLDLNDKVILRRTK